MAKKVQFFFKYYVQSNLKIIKLYEQVFKLQKMF